MYEAPFGSVQAWAYDKEGRDSKLRDNSRAHPKFEHLYAASFRLTNGKNIVKVRVNMNLKVKRRLLKILNAFYLMIVRVGDVEYVVDFIVVEALGEI